MRWTLRCRSASGTLAYGEIVWSWRPNVRRQVADDAQRIAAMTVANGKVHRGEHV
jgi:hypothetical protein